MNCPNGVTATGTVPSHKRTIACPKKLLGKTVLLEGIGKRVCEDTGGAITEGRFDLYVKDIALAFQFGKRTVSYEVL